MSESELEEKLKLINEAIEKADGNPKQEAALLNALIDPADAVACEGCQ